MTKTIISTIALVLVLQGCGSSSNSTNDTAPKAEVSSEIKSFAKGLAGDSSVSKVVKKGASSSQDSSSVSKDKMYQKNTLDSCTDGGTREVISDIDFENIDENIFEQLTSDGFKVNLVANNCIEDGMKIDASMEVFFKERATTIIFKEDSTFENLETYEIYTILKNSNVTIDELSNTEEMITESIKGSSSIEGNFESINLVTHEIFTEDIVSSYETSGEILHNGITYRVDKEYDSSKTPMVSENYEDLVSGTAKYFNENNHHIIVEVIGKNQIKISVDTDNDGDIDEEEIIAL